MNYAFPKVTSMIVMFFFLTGPRAPLCVCVKEECAIQRVLVYPCVDIAKNEGLFVIHIRVTLFHENDWWFLLPPLLILRKKMEKWTENKQEKVLANCCRRVT